MDRNRVIGLHDGGDCHAAAAAPGRAPAFARSNPAPRPKEWEIAVNSSTLYLMVFWLLLGVALVMTLMTWYWIG